MLSDSNAIKSAIKVGRGSAMMSSMALLGIFSL